MAKYILSHTKLTDGPHNLIIYEGDTKDVYHVRVDGEKIKIYHLLQDNQGLIKHPVSLLSEIGLDITSLLNFEAWGNSDDNVSS